LESQAWIYGLGFTGACSGWRLLSFAYPEIQPPGVAEDFQARSARQNKKPHTQRGGFRAKGVGGQGERGLPFLRMNNAPDDLSFPAQTANGPHLFSFSSHFDTAGFGVDPLFTLSFQEVAFFGKGLFRKPFSLSGQRNRNSRVEY
jgi:hypothetical protein